ncbi:glycosyltransferase family 9 protein, partial [bacterium]|nr:glycosyltransferase family 9 protein [bacterium]
CLIIDIVGNRFNSLLCKVNLNRSIGLNRYDLKSFYRHQYGNMKGIHESLNFLSFLPEILKYTNNRVFTKTKAILEKLNKILVHNKNILIDYSNYQTIYKPFFSAYKHQLSESDISWGKYFIYHAGGHKDKCFPYTSQINLISKLSELHLTAVIVGQDHESNRGRIIETEFKKHGCNVINMCGMTDDLFQLAELFKDTEFYVGPDSGTAHLSAALGTETIVYFGSTNSIRFSPAGSNVHIFTSSCKCSPCWEPQIPFSCKNYDCMEIINFPGLLDFFNKFKLDNA